MVSPELKICSVPGCVVDGCCRPATTRSLCQMHYQRLRKNGSLDLPPRACVVCSAVAVGSKYCFACQRATKNRRKRSAEYIARKRERDRKRRQRPEVRARNRAQTRIRDRIKEHKRRAAEYGVDAEKFDPIEILERDRWRCGLCGCATPKAKRGTYDANAPELDHIIPISTGGAHVRANVQCACRACNLSKGKKPLGQLRLVG